MYSLYSRNPQTAFVQMGLAAESSVDLQKVWPVPKAEENRGGEDAWLSLLMPTQRLSIRGSMRTCDRASGSSWHPEVTNRCMQSQKERDTGNIEKHGSSEWTQDSRSAPRMLVLAQDGMRQKNAWAKGDHDVSLDRSEGMQGARPWTLQCIVR